MDDPMLLTRIAERPAVFRACDIGSIIEIDTVTPIPRAPAFVTGLAALRSRALTVIDSRRALGVAAPGPADPRSPVVEIAGHPYALLVDSVEDVVAAIGSPTPVATTLGPQWTRCAHGMIETAAGPAIVIDVSALIAGPQRAAA
ncbi:chemotaxis protein CheW [Pelagerythrobacter marensis]|uniref:Chemotaxis protein CheW n=1 Tax=Pelagerythrobacter marensis TaxID=543877 RepID=A0ABZ2D390_9SPHN